MGIITSQCPVLLSICDHKNDLIPSIQPIEAVESPMDLLATIVQTCGYIFPDGKPSDEHIRIEFRHQERVERRYGFQGLKRAMVTKKQQCTNPTSFIDLLKVIVRFDTTVVQSSKIDFELSSSVTLRGVLFQKEIYEALENRVKCALETSSDLWATIMKESISFSQRFSGKLPKIDASSAYDSTVSELTLCRSQLRHAQTMLSVQFDINKEMIMDLQRQEQELIDQCDWTEIGHCQIEAHVKNLEEKVVVLNEELEETNERFEERIDELTEENKRLEGYEVQVAEIDEKLRQLIAKARDGKVDIAALAAIRKPIP